MAVIDEPKGLSAAFAGPHAWCNEKMMLSENLSDGIPLSDFFASGAFDRTLSHYAGPPAARTAAPWPPCGRSIISPP